jgi:hypothetical protein
MVAASLGRPRLRHPECLARAGWATITLDPLSHLLLRSKQGTTAKQNDMTVIGDLGPPGHFVWKRLLSSLTLSGIILPVVPTVKVKVPLGSPCLQLSPSADAELFSCSLRPLGLYLQGSLLPIGPFSAIGTRPR